jgi:glycosyltransferase involved in cell wall biosynthesis
VDVKALAALVRFGQEHRIQLMHAHGTSLFIACAASLFPPFPAVLWHDHLGSYWERSVLLYRLATRRVSAVVGVNEAMAKWSRETLRVRSERVRYLPNFVATPATDGSPVDLPGERGARIVCVANLRPQKDQLSLIDAMRLVVERIPTARLVLVGDRSDTIYSQRLEQRIVQHGLSESVTHLGQRDDVAAVLRSCDVGVLSSQSEGFPLALVEYGMAGLPVVATRIGQCPEILEKGEAGLLVQPNSPGELAAALVTLLSSSEERKRYAARLHARVRTRYSASAIVADWCQLYEAVTRAAGRPPRSKEGLR